MKNQWSARRIEAIVVLHFGRESLPYILSDLISGELKPLFALWFRKEGLLLGTSGVISG